MNFLQLLFLSVGVTQLCVAAGSAAIEAGDARGVLARATLLHLLFPLQSAAVALYVWPDWALGYAIEPTAVNVGAVLAAVALAPPLAGWGAAALVRRGHTDWLPITAGISLFFAVAPYGSALERTLFVGTLGEHLIGRSRFALTIPGFAWYWTADFAFYGVAAWWVLHGCRRLGPADESS